MLKEFAFTPHVFDPNADPKDPLWREHIRAILAALFRVPAAPPIVVSGLHWHGDSSTWEQITQSLIENIDHGESRRDAQAFFTQVTKHMVRRPPEQDWPGDDESGWGKEAALANTRESLDRIVAQQVANVPDGAPRRALSDVAASDFWNVLQPKPYAPKNVGEAVAPLRLILRHSDLLVLSMPYANLESFTLECVCQACRRPAGQAAPTIHVHREAPPSVDAKMAWIRSELAGKLGAAEVYWHFWPEPYRERVVLGCRLADVGGGRRLPSVRWGVSMTHLWGEGDPAKAEPATWTLLSLEKAKAHLALLDKGATELRLLPQKV